MEAFIRFKTRVYEVIKSDIIDILMVIGVVIGCVLGIVLLQIRKTPYSSREIMYISFPGELFLHMLKGVAIVLMTACLVTAIGSLDIKLSKRIGLQLVVYALSTKIFSVLLGIILSLSLRPGIYGRSADDKDEGAIPVAKKNITTADTFLDVVRNMFPPNMVLMFLSSYETVLIKPENRSINIHDWEVEEGGKMNNVPNMLGIVCYSIFLGIALSVMATEGKPLLDLYRCITGSFMKLTIWILWLSPVLIIFLIAGHLVGSKGFISLLSELGMYITCIILGHGLLAFFIMPLLYFLFVWKNPFILMRSVVGTLVTAFATMSSLASLAKAVNDLEKAGYDKRIVQFVVPLGINLNKDGTAIYQGIATVFFAQMYERSLTFSNIITILLMGTAVSMATAGVPFSGAIMLIMILEGLDLPYSNIGLIISVDWFVDRLVTVVNVWGNCVLTAILAHVNRHFIRSSDEEQRTEDRSPDVEDIE